MVLTIVFAPSGRRVQHIWQLTKDIMRSGLCPPLGLVSGVIFPALRYCDTECGTDACAMCATTCTNKLLLPAREPNVPMLSTHAERYRFTGSWHLVECGRNEFGNF